MAASETKPAEESGGHNTASGAERDDGYTPECGMGKFKPAALRRFANMPMFTGVYSVSALMTSTLTTYVNSQVTTLEKHFGFNSSQTGLIMAANDMGFLLVVLFVSFVATKVHIPRALGYFTILFGLSGIVCALPQFLFGAPSPASWNGAGNVSSMTSAKPSGRFEGQLCDGVNHTSLGCDVEVDGPGELQGEGPVHAARAHAGTSLALIVVGMVLQGVAKTPRSSLTSYYVDSNVPAVSTGFYMGIIIAVAIMGPAVAYALGGLFTRMYVTLEDTNLHYRHPGWIGAWWLGYITFGCISLLVALPLFCFPRRLKGGKRIKEPALSLTERVNVPRKMSQFVKEFLSAMLRLLTNPVYMCTVLSSCAFVFCVAGGMSFTPKYIENQFSFPAWKANMALAGVTLGTSCLGTFLGGYVTRRRRAGPLASLHIIVAMLVVSGLLTGLLILCHCPQPLVHNSPGPRATGETSLQGCADSCVCDDGEFFPVCGDDGRTFFSPCHAGCNSTARGNYVNCTCIQDGTAEAGMCDYSCAMFYPFILVIAVKSLFSTFAIIPHMIVYLRCVEERDKALGLGFSSFLASLTGWLLGPICFGKLIDGICIQWEQSCTGGGACLLYDNADFRLKLYGYQVLFLAVSLVFILLALLSARVTRKFKENEEPLGGDATMTAMLPEKGDHCPDKDNSADTHV
ncbi:solute carrier organic anion transporter family member 2A1-like [Babylonia areolata]|uniref:solute carrier organic anion transporter family member 2A1-like n=1 Tax=Babylonia areolata TaxID=304850 RepID=UPI003FD043A1